MKLCGVFDVSGIEETPRRCDIDREMSWIIGSEHHSVARPYSAFFFLDRKTPLEKRCFKTLITTLDAYVKVAHDHLIAVVFRFLPLIKNAKDVVLNRVLFFLYDLPAVQALPTFKINEMVEEGLHYHQALTFRALHYTSFPLTFSHCNTMSR